MYTDGTWLEEPGAARRAHAMIAAMKPFWEEKTLAEMTKAEWESLCDGCGRCCLVVLQDEDTEEVFETDVCCRLFDPKTRRCSGYGKRHALVPDCVKLTPKNAGALSWMPETCAYRRLARGEDLPEWHPLLTGDPESVARAGIAVSRDLLNEEDVPSRDLDRRVTLRR